MSSSIYSQAGVASPQRARSDSANEASYVLRHYDVDRTIGEGGFAKVKLAKHKLTGVQVAIKIVETKHLSAADAQRLNLEIEALQRLRHQHICQLYEVHRYDTRVYMTLELAKNGELFDYIVAKKRLREHEARKIFRQVAQAVAYCHERHIIHRDLKPENILLDDDHDVKLVDFGLVASLGSHNDYLQTCCGSPAYAAPELIRGDKYVGNKADMWSLGVLLYALLCGYLPFDHDNVNELYKLIVRGKFDMPVGMSEPTRALIQQLLAVDPNRRPTIHELLAHPWMYIGFEHQGRLTSASTLPDDYDHEIVAEIGRYYGRDPREIAAIVARNTKKDHEATLYHLLLKKKAAGLPVTLAKPTDPPADKDKARNGNHNERTPSMTPGHAGAGTAATHASRAPTSSTVYAPAPVPFGGLGFSMPRVIPGIVPGVAHKRPGAVHLPTTPTGVTKRPSIDHHQLSKSYDQGLNIIDFNNHGHSWKEPASAQPSSMASYSFDMFNFKTERANSVDSGAALQQLLPNKDSKFDTVGNDSRESLDVEMGESRPSRRGTFDNITASLRSVFNPPPSPKGYAPRIVRDQDFRADTTSNKPPKLVLQEVMRALVHNEVQLSQKEPFLLHCAKKRHDIVWEMEICQLEHLGSTGIVSRRVKGDRWLYKEIVRDIMAQLSL